MCKRIYKEQTSEQGDVPFFKIGTFGANPDAFISNELFEDFKCIYPYPTPGTLLISAAGSIGRVVEYQGEKAYFQDSNIVWLEHDHRLNDAFLKPLYSRIEWGLEGSTIKRLYNKDLLSAEVTVPGGREQKEIGQFFAKLDNLITLHQRKCETLQKLKKSMLQKMFPKNGSLYPEIRFAGFTDAWEQRKLGELSETTYGGGTPNTSNLEYWNGDIPWIQSSDIVEHQLYGTEPKKYITQTGLSKSATKLIPANSIAIVTRVGVGKLGVMPFSYTSSQDFLSLSNLNVDIDFGAYLIYKKIQSELNAVQGTSIKGVTKEELLKKKVLVPSKEEQRQIGTYFRNLDNLITLHQRKFEKLTNVKKSMLEKMFPQNGSSYPEIRFKGFTDPWEQRKFGEITSKYEDPVPTPHDGYYRLGIRSHAKGTFHSYVAKGQELETAQMHRVAAGNFIVNITFGWEHAVAITDKNDAGKLVSHRFPQFSFAEGMVPEFFR